MISKYFPILSLPVSIIFIVYMMSQNISLPGFYYDDAYYARLTLLLLQNAPPNSYAVDTVTILGHVFPTYITYQGFLHSYLYIPFYEILGGSTISMRILGIIINAATLVVTYFFSKEIFDKKTAAISVIILATLSTFLFYGKFSGWVSTELFLFFISSLYFLFKWKNTNKTKFLLASTFVIGLGISTKLIFLWTLPGLLIFFVLYKNWKDLSLKKILLSIITFCAGSILFLLYIIKSGASFIHVVMSGSSKTLYGASNTDFLSNLSLRINQFVDILSGNSLGMLGGMYSNLLPVFLFLISVIGYFFLAKYSKIIHLKNGVFIIVLFFTMIVLSSFTLSTFNPAQLLILLPIPSIIIASFLSSLIDSAKKWDKTRIITLCVGIVVSALIITNIITITEYNNSLERTGGVGNFSDQNDNLAKFLLENQYYHPIALDWGFANPTYVITDGKVDSKEIFGYPDLGGNTNVNSFVMTLENSFKDPNNVYLIHSPGQQTSFDRRDLFEKTAESTGKKLILIKEFYQRDGLSVIQVFKAE